MNVYAIITDQDPVYNTNDFISATWLTITELQTLIKEGEPTKGDLPILIDFLHKII